MTQPARQRPWRTALLWVAVAAVVAGVVVGTWFRPAATTHITAPAVPPRPDTPPAPAAAASVGATPADVVDPPAVHNVPVVAIPDAKGSSSSTASRPDADTDLSRLRARALTLPVSGVAASQLTDTYTQARAAGAPHEALDIMAPRGTPVFAVEDGPVAKLFLSKPGGITLYQFDPDAQYAYYYAHLDRYADGIAEGSKLVKGQVIGYVGSTGNASPDAPHLHFAVFRLGPEKQWWRGTPINPFGIWRSSPP